MATQVSNYPAMPAPPQPRPGLLQWLVLALLIAVLLTTGLVLALVSVFGRKEPLAPTRKRRLPGMTRLAPEH